MGLDSLADLGSVSNAIKTAGAGAARKVGRTAEAAASQGTEWLRWAAPLALLAAVLFGLYYWSGGLGQPQPNPAQTPDLAQATKTVSENASERLDQADSIGQGHRKVA